MTHFVRRPRARLALLLPLLVLAPGAAVAQATPSAAEQRRAEDRFVTIVTRQAAEQKAEDRRIVQSQGDSGSFGYSPAGIDFQLSTNREDSEASLVLSTEIGRTRSNYDPVSGDDRRSSWSSRLYLRGVASLGDDKDAERFVDLTHPLGGSRITAGFVHYFSNYTLRRADILGARVTRYQVLSTCVNQTVGAWQATSTSPDEIALGNRYLEAFRERLGNVRHPETALSEVNEDSGFADIPEEVRTRCEDGQEGSEGDFLAMISRFGTADMSRELLRSITGNAPTFFMGAEATVSQNDFSFLNRTTFTLDDESHRGYAVSAFGGVIGGNGRWSLRAGVSYTRDYDEQDSIELCRPVPNSTDIQCLTGADGAPTRSTQTLVSVEGRALVRTRFGDIGLAPAFAIDADTGDYTVALPIYAARNDDNQLTGGLRVAYSSKDDDVAFGFFIGVPFNILN